MASILIVDDNRQNLYLLETVLHAHKHDVVSAFNGAEALALARARPPDLVISDILMPVMDGFELCRQWKQDGRLGRIPFIFYTATYVDRENKQFALGLGADRFAVKPQEPDVLAGIVREVLDEHACGRQAATPTIDVTQAMREYNETLFRKLEKKVNDLECEVAERKRTELALRASEEKFSKAFHASPLMMALISLAGFRYIEVNAAFERVMGGQGKDIVGKRVEDVNLWDNPREFIGILERAVANSGCRNVELKFVVRAGDVHIGLVSVEPVELNATRCVLTVTEDITERRDAELQLDVYQSQLRKLVSQVTLAEQRERRRIAAGLHDDVCQSLVAAKTRLGSAALGPDNKVAIAEAEAAMDNALQSLRTLMFDLCPPALHELELDGALAWLAGLFQRQYGIPCHVHCAAAVRVKDEAVRTMVYIAVRELLANVAKHAHARQVDITVEIRDGALRVEVEDDGAGCTPEDNGGANNRFGLFSVRERIGSFGGSFELFSQLGNGTTAIITVPYKPGNGLEGNTAVAPPKGGVP